MDRLVNNGSGSFYRYFVRERVRVKYHCGLLGSSRCHSVLGQRGLSELLAGDDCLSQKSGSLNVGVLLIVDIDGWELPKDKS